MTRSVSLALIGLGTLATLAAIALTFAVTFGGPKPISAMESINAPFKGLDYRQMPAISRFTARDGTALAYRHYAAPQGASAPVVTTSAATPRRIVLVHGSSASSRSMHPMAMALVAAGFAVDVLDIRGHGDSGTRSPVGHINYIGQLEDDVVDFMKAVPHAGPNTLVGFSAGGGFVLRFSASPQATSNQTALFDRYVLLAPFLVQAPSNRPSAGKKDGGWASVGLQRIIALTVLNGFGVTGWNHLPVTQFALNAEAAKFLTSSYSYALATNFGAHLDYKDDIRRAPAHLQVIAGVDDELMFSERYAEVFKAAGKNQAVTLVPGANHIGLTLNANALQTLVAALQKDVP